MKSLKQRLQEEGIESCILEQCGLSDEAIAAELDISLA